MHREVERTSGIVLDRTPTSDSRRYLLGSSTPLGRAEFRLVDTIRELKTKISRLDDYYRRIVQRELVTAIYTALGYDNSVPRNRFYQDLIKDPTLAREVFGNRTGLDANNLPAILSALDPRNKNPFLIRGLYRQVELPLCPTASKVLAGNGGCLMSECGRGRYRSSAQLLDA
jgi:hypothetical protein